MEDLQPKTKFDINRNKNSLGKYSFESKIKVEGNLLDVYHSAELRNKKKRQLESGEKQTTKDNELYQEYGQLQSYQKVQQGNNKRMRSILNRRDVVPMVNYDIPRAVIDQDNLLHKEQKHISQLNQMQKIKAN